MTLRFALAAAAFACAPLAGLAQTPPADGEGAAPACATTDTALPADLAAWTHKTDIASAADAKGLSAAAVQPGVAVNAALHPTRQVAYAAQPEKPGGSVAHGGLLGFTISEAGTYRVALGSGAWIDVLKNGEAIDSSDHGHGPACSSIRKVVSFALQPGAYVLQISANAGDRVGVLITRAP